MDAEKNKTEGGTLYLVGTPIGNLADLSPRAIRVLSEVTFLAAEDTRNTRKLLTCAGIHTGDLVSYHEHNKKASGERILARLLTGDSCALVTDAGMPAISDPGEDLVRLCAGAGIPVTVIPGPCAAVSALALSAQATGRFCFEGFLPTARGERDARIRALQTEERTTILYEAPHRLLRTLEALCEGLAEDRGISLCRELTKRNEEVMRTTLREALAYYREHEPRGEYVLVLAGATHVPEKEENTAMVSLPPEEHVRVYEERGMSRMDAIKAAAKDRGMTKSELYKLLLQ